MKTLLRAASFVATVVFCLSVNTQTIQAQTTPNDPNNQSPGVAGVFVDAEGVLRNERKEDPNGAVTAQRIQAARTGLDPKLVKKSDLRKISLNRLEAEMKKRLADGQKPTEDMLHLAGMTRIKYVFYYPETKDIVIAGPAGGYAADLSGRVRNIDSGMPTLMLDDMIVALRTFFKSDADRAPLVSVSIDPTKEGLQKMQTFLQGIRPTPGDAEFIVNGLRESLGLQTIRLTGVSSKSHFAQVLVEADYRMKLIGIGLENPQVKMASYPQRANPSTVSRNALSRWYFVPDYQCVRVANDELGMEMVGDGVKLLSEDEFVQLDGSRAKNKNVDLASKGFTTDFTKNFTSIAAASPVFWQLRNCIDMLVATAFIKNHKYADKADWKMSVFLDENQYPVETLNVPKQVETAVTSLWKGQRLMTPVGGGVRIQPENALTSSNLLSDKDAKVAKQRDAIDLKSLKDNQWWWD
jgi:hypothetical protein